MKPFNLEAAKRGDPCMRRSGDPVKFVVHVPEATGGQKVIFIGKNGWLITRNEDGYYLSPEKEHLDDIVMAPKKKIVWVNIYGLNEAHWFGTKEAAEDSAKLHEVLRKGNQAWPLEIEE